MCLTLSIYQILTEKILLRVIDKGDENQQSFLVVEEYIELLPSDRNCKLKSNKRY